MKSGFKTVWELSACSVCRIFYFKASLNVSVEVNLLFLPVFGIVKIMDVQVDLQKSLQRGTRLDGLSPSSDICDWLLYIVQHTHSLACFLSFFERALARWCTCRWHRKNTKLSPCIISFSLFFSYLNDSICFSYAIESIFKAH